MVVVVGGGAAGIMAAIAAARRGARVLILERNPRIGIKILISGGGRCNVTHQGSARDIERGFTTREARFLRHSLHCLSPADVTTMLHQSGVETYVRSNGRVFPSSERAEDVLDAFERMLRDAGVVVRTSSRVTALSIVDNRVRGVETDDDYVDADAVILATGGVSYRKVGTTGDGVEWCRELGIDVEPFSAALAPIYFDVPPPDDWHGVSLRDVRVSVHLRSAPLRTEARSSTYTQSTGPACTLPAGVHLSWRGDLVLTHRGMSGPSVLEVSRAVACAMAAGMLLSVTVDCVPAIGDDALRSRWDRTVSSSPRTEVQTFLAEFVPRALVSYMLASLDVPVGLRLADAHREVRSRLLYGLKHWTPGVVGEVPIDRGEVTAGGIALTEVDPLTMRVRRIDRLYAAGEALDVAGSVGGYNLQAAFSTGWVAGLSAAAPVAEAGGIRIARSK